MTKEITHPIDSALMKIFRIFLILIGSVSVVLSIFSFASWAHAVYVSKIFSNNGLAVKATVTGKESRRFSGHSSAFNQSYYLDLSYRYCVDSNSVLVDCKETTPDFFSTVSDGQPGQMKNYHIKIARAKVSEFVYFKAWSSLRVGDNVDILILPENPEAGIILKSFIEDTSTHPLLLRPLSGFVLLLIGLSGFYFFKVSGGDFRKPPW